LPRAWDDAIGRQAILVSLRDSASFYKWRAKFGGMDASLISEMKDMAEQNRRLKKMYAEMSMQNDLLKEALGKKR
jgi:putative transposase